MSAAEFAEGADQRLVKLMADYFIAYKNVMLLVVPTSQFQLNILMARESKPMLSLVVKLVTIHQSPWITAAAKYYLLSCYSPLNVCTEQ